MKNSKYILAGMSAFCLVLITATSIKSSFLMPLRTGVGFVLVPLQSGVNAIGTGLYNTLENFSSLREAQEENKNLQMRLDQMVEENNRLQSELYELDRLRELYQLDQEYMQYKKIAARVIAKDSGNWFQVFQKTAARPVIKHHAAEHARHRIAAQNSVILPEQKPERRKAGKEPIRRILHACPK